MKSLYREKVWADLQSRKEEGELTEYLFESEDGTVRYRFFKRTAGEVDGKLYYDIASYRGAEGPYIEQSAEGRERELLTAFRAAFAQYCREQDIIAEFAKLDPWDEHAQVIREVLGAEYYGNFYCNDLTRDFAGQDYNRRARRSIRKAREMGVTASADWKGDTIPDFIRLYRNTEEKFHTGFYYTFSEEDIREYFDMLPGRCFLSNAVAEGRIITSVLVAVGEDVMHYLFLGNDVEHLAYQGNSLLTYETAMIGKELGLKVFDMGGGKPGGKIEEFKRNFISDDGVWAYYAVKKVWNEEVYNALLARKETIENPNMFPLYRG
ncbi:MAG: GNAT family N-acetyltransferase [Clostridia bacterium]|nr:GNAT family N-acetyltransferase [Clostridia bacterium]